MFVLPYSRRRILLGLGIVYVLVQYICVGYYNELRRYDNLISTSTQEYITSTNPVPITHLNVSGVQTLVSKQTAAEK